MSCFTFHFLGKVCIYEQCGHYKGEIKLITGSFNLLPSGAKTNGSSVEGVLA